MGFFNLFRKKKEIKKKKLDYSKLGSFLSSEKKKLEEKESEIIVIIKEKIQNLIQELSQEIEVLKEVDISHKREQPRIKRATLEGLDIFKIKLEEFIEKLRKIDNKDLNELIKYLDNIFRDFNKKSHLSFEKATILIGKEMADVKESLGKFSNEIDKIMKESDEEIHLNKSLKETEKILEEIKQIEEKKNEIKNEIENLKEEVKMDKENIEQKKKKIEEIKNSKEYKEEQKKREELSEKKHWLEKKIYELKNLIDFKELAKRFHSFEKDMDLIKRYKDSFRETFEGDKGDFFIKNIKDNIKIKIKIQEILDLNREISKTRIEKNNLDEYENEIIENENSINYLERNIEKFNQKVESNEDEINSKKTLLAKALDKLDVELVLD